jgi:hypothetical protein
MTKVLMAKVPDGENLFLGFSWLNTGADKLNSKAGCRIVSMVFPVHEIKTRSPEQESTARTLLLEFYEVREEFIEVV